jgi:transketolase
MKILWFDYSQDYFYGTTAGLAARLQHKLDDVGITMTMPDAIYPSVKPQAFNGRPLKQAFTESIRELGEKNTSIVVLDSDLSADNGLWEFERLYPKRFIQCGIAEQDMVSMAGAISRSGRLPIVNTYAAFLTSRANEQIFNNCSEGDKVIYVGHLAGLLPSRPGKSHQGIRDILLLAAIPDLLMVSPCNSNELKQAMRLLVKKTKVSSYLRLEHAPGRDDVALPDGYKVEIGKGCIVYGSGNLRSDLVIISYGPLMLQECIQAAKELEHEKVIAKVINLPWLNTVDWEWLKSAIGSTSAIVCVENHSGVGGQSIMLSKKYKVHTIGVDGFGQSGGNEEIMKHYRMDHQSLVGRIYEEVLE